MVSWKLSMFNTEQMVFLNVKLPAKTLTHINTCRNIWENSTHTHRYTFINNYPHSHIYRQICKVFPAPQFQDLKVKMWNQVKVRLMWKTDDTVSSLTESSCRKTILLSLLQDDKGRALTFNNECAGPESVHVRLRSCWLEALWRCCRQGFAHSVWSSTHWPVETMTQHFNNVRIWTLRLPQFMRVCDWLRTCRETVWI